MVESRLDAIKALVVGLWVAYRREANPTCGAFFEKEWGLTPFPISSVFLVGDEGVAIGAATYRAKVGGLFLFKKMGNGRYFGWEIISNRV